MANFEVLVYRINAPVVSHPTADKLSLVQIAGYTCISAKLEDGSHRYTEGDLVVYIPENSVLPDWMLKKMGFWDDIKNKGTLSNANGNRVKPIRLRGIFSQGILYPVCSVSTSGEIRHYVVKENSENYMDAAEDMDVAAFLGITKWEPNVPVTMMGRIIGRHNVHTVKYDFDSIQKNTNMFTKEMDWVAVTEKIHGTFVEIGYIPHLRDEALFGENGNIFVTSKGLAAKGFVLENTETNKRANLYVKILDGLLVSNNLEKSLLRMKELYETTTTIEVTSIHFFGEIFGTKIQDLDYGADLPRILLFDIMVNKNFLNLRDFIYYTKILKMEPVPVLYVGKYAYDTMVTLRDGKTTLSGNHIREGIVIKSVSEEEHPKYGRKIAKFISPDYLLRKNGTEFN